MLPFARADEELLDILTETVSAGVEKNVEQRPVQDCVGHESVSNVNVLFYCAKYLMKCDSAQVHA